MESFFIFFMYFFIYSVLGWIVETLYCRTLDGKWTNRGFLFGPYCPSYGFGALIIIAFLGAIISRKNQIIIKKYFLVFIHFPPIFLLYYYFFTKVFFYTIIFIQFLV